jgi:hypothetical protein
MGFANNIDPGMLRSTGKNRQNRSAAVFGLSGRNAASVGYWVRGIDPNGNIFVKSVSTQSKR